jgi:hypothetical protein
LTAASVLAFGFAGYVMPSYYTPFGYIQTAIETKKQDRLPVGPVATFADRFDAVYEIDRSKYPALEAWLRDHGVTGPVVAKGGAQ